MLLRRSAFLIAILCLIAGLVAPLTVKAKSTVDISAVWKDYTVAQKRFQFDLAKLLTDEWPNLVGVAGLERDLQFALIELKNMRFNYLVDYAPERLVLDKGLSAFAGFEWTETDSEALREINANYPKLERWVEKFTAELSEHPDFPEAERQIISLQHHDYYRSMVERYQARMVDIESALNIAARSK
jgi:hypothetical protein